MQFNDPLRDWGHRTKRPAVYLAHFDKYDDSSAILKFYDLDEAERWLKRSLEDIARHRDELAHA